MDQEFVKWLASLGIGGILAALFYYQSRKDAKENAEQRLKDAQMYQDKLLVLHEVERGRTDKMLDIIRENTTSTTINTEVLRSLHGRLDADEADRDKRRVEDKNRREK